MRVICCVALLAFGASLVLAQKADEKPQAETKLLLNEESPDIPVEEVLRWLARALEVPVLSDPAQIKMCFRMHLPAQQVDWKAEDYAWAASAPLDDANLGFIGLAEKKVRVTKVSEIGSLAPVVDEQGLEKLSQWEWARATLKLNRLETADALRVSSPLVSRNGEVSGAGPLTFQVFERVDRVRRIQTLLRSIENDLDLRFIVRQYALTSEGSAHFLSAARLLLGRQDSVQIVQATCVAIVSGSEDQHKEIAWLVACINQCSGAEPRSAKTLAVPEGVDPGAAQKFLADLFPDGPTFAAIPGKRMLALRCTNAELKQVEEAAALLKN